MKKDKKILALAMFVLMMTSCGVWHKNIVKGISSNNLLVEDAETHQDRVITLNMSGWNGYLLEYTHIGDTVEIKSPCYENLVLKAGGLTDIGFNGDSIDNRYQRHQLELKKKELFSGKVK